MDNQVIQATLGIRQGQKTKKVKKNVNNIITYSVMLVLQAEFLVPSIVPIVLVLRP
jgi:hypothetical protein